MKPVTFNHIGGKVVEVKTAPAPPERVKGRLERFFLWLASLCAVALLAAVPAGAQGGFNQGGMAAVKQPAGSLYTSSATASLAGVTAEALFSFSDCRNGVCAAPAASHAVTSTATLRLNGICASWVNGTAAAGGVTVRCRINPISTVVSTSTVFATLSVGTSLTTANSGATACSQFPGGIELRAPMQWGCSQFAVTTSSGFDFNVFGVEY